VIAGRDRPRPQLTPSALAARAAHDHQQRSRSSLGRRRHAGAHGYKYIEIVADDPAYTSAYSCELIHLGPGDQSQTHVEDYNHLLFFVEGSGEITIGDRTWPLSPGSYAKVKAGDEHSLRNLGDTEMLIMTVYDPPRVRS
jgi:mannose-6-phosphate isomerase-like protein (cupin superfamily)